MSDTSGFEIDETEEQYLRFVASLRDLVRSEHLNIDDRLSAINQATEMALSGSVVDAADWVQQLCSV